MKYKHISTVKRTVMLWTVLIVIGGFLSLISYSILVNYISKGDDNIKSGTVLIMENGTFQTYIIVESDSEKYCLLRQNLLDQQMVFNDKEQYFSYYADSMIDQYLNGPFWESLGETVRSSIIESPISIVADSSIGICGGETETILRRVFLPSRMEITGYSTGVSPPEGKKFTLLEEDQIKASDSAGLHGVWWLRSPNTWYSNVLFVITQDGSTNYVSTTGLSGDTALGVRPAFWIKSDALITDSNGHYFIR